MSASLVGSEMCIRDSSVLWRGWAASATTASKQAAPRTARQNSARTSALPCLLYTSDAADDM
eukprot:11084977-Alexandrium_andersonii.AAC.1